MKITILMLAILAMIGSAMAWDSTDKLSYSFEKTMYVQAGDPLDLRFNNPPGGSYNDASGAYFQVGTPYGDSEAYVANKMVSASSTEIGATGAGLSPSQTLTLTQGGSAMVVTRARDSQDALPEEAAYVDNYQNLHFSGDYSRVSAGFESEATAGIDNRVDGLSDLELVATTHGEEANPVYGAVQVTGQAKFTEADIGMEGQSSVVRDDVTGVSFLSGRTDAWSAFTGGQIFCPSGIIQTETGEYETDHYFNSANVNIPNPYNNAFPKW